MIVKFAYQFHFLYFYRSSWTTKFKIMCSNSNEPRSFSIREFLAFSAVCLQTGSSVWKLSLSNLSPTSVYHSYGVITRDEPIFSLINSMRALTEEISRVIVLVLVSSRTLADHNPLASCVANTSL